MLRESQKPRRRRSSYSKVGSARIDLSGLVGAIRVGDKPHDVKVMKERMLTANGFDRSEC